MAKGKQLGSPQRTTRIPIRGAKLEAADRLLSAAKEADAAARMVRGELASIPRWRFRRWRRTHTQYVIWLERFNSAITAAQDLANKRVGNRDDMTPNW